MSLFVLRDEALVWFHYRVENQSIADSRLYIAMYFFSGTSICFSDLRFAMLAVRCPWHYMLEYMLLIPGGKSANWKIDACPKELYMFLRNNDMPTQYTNKIVHFKNVSVACLHLQYTLASPILQVWYF